MGGNCPGKNWLDGDCPGEVSPGEELSGVGLSKVGVVRGGVFT